MASESRSSKRKKISDEASASAGDHHHLLLNIHDLPSGALECVACFLAAPSRALLDVALDVDGIDQNPSAADGPRNNIVGACDILDFGEIEKELATKLSDEDISAVLLHIDAVNRVKRLVLTNCVNITGAGLTPLRGSIVIAQIDLSLIAGCEDPKINPEPQISCDEVLPILDSIIEREGCALKHLRFPFVWRKEPSIDSEFHAFLTRYNTMWTNRDIVHCIRCNHNLQEDTEWIGLDTNVHDYGLQDYTCYKCLNNYCGGDHPCNDDEDMMLHHCNNCKQEYCSACATLVCCSCCGNYYCMGGDFFTYCSGWQCGDIICDNCITARTCGLCGEKLCDDCNDLMHTCSSCNEVRCIGCFEKEGGSGEEDLCHGCRVRKCERKRKKKRRKEKKLAQQSLQMKTPTKEDSVERAEGSGDIV